jgi:hypothetical protein
MSKKLIAVAAAAALALTGLVAVPASGAAQSITLNGSANSTTATVPLVIHVPDDNTIADNTNAQDITISGDEGDAYSLTTTGSVKLVSAVATGTKDLNVTTLGKSSFTGTLPAAATLTFYVYTTSTDVGTVVVSLTRAGLATSTTMHIKGGVGEAYNFTATGAPATLAKGAKAVIDMKVTDVFGNALEGADAETLFGAAGVNVSAKGVATATLTRTGASTWWNASTKTYQGTLTSTTNNPFIVEIGVDGDTAAGIGDPSVNGLPDAAHKAILIVNNPAAATANAALTAQIAALQVIVDRKVTKKRFNTLARKWNAAFPSQKVKLKK